MVRAASRVQVKRSGEILVHEISLPSGNREEVWLDD